MVSEMAEALDPERCPLCGEGNACGIAQGAESCWCFDTEISAEVRARIPSDARGRACLCERCASERSVAPRKLKVVANGSRD
jgi:hypothetical protein